VALNMMFNGIFTFRLLGSSWTGLLNRLVASCNFVLLYVMMQGVASGAQSSRGHDADAGKGARIRW